MKQKALSKAIQLVVTGALVSGLAACGGSGSGSDSSAAVSKDGASVGAVTGFGSVYVNGTHFNTNNAVIRGADGIERESQLEKGMILKVEGTWGDDREGVANVIYYDDTLRGPIDAVSSPWNPAVKEGALVIAGQTVHLNSRTVFKGKSPERLAADDLVRVSGWRLPDHSFQASFVGIIGQESAGTFKTVEVEGVVTAVSEIDSSFELNNNLTVVFDSATFEDGTANDLKVGARVDVEGRLAAIQGNRTLTAGHIDFESDLFDGVEDVELSGAVTGAYSGQTGSFQVNGVDVAVDSNTEFDDLSLADLVEGVEIEVEGEYRNGVLVAEDIELLEANAELKGRIQATVESEVLTVSGVRVQLSNRTLIEDDDLEDDQEYLTLRTEDLNSLNIGNCVEIEGRVSVDGSSLMAYHVEREDADDCDDGFELEGRVSAVAADFSSISLMGLTLVRADGGLFDGYQVGDQVEVEYTKSNGGEYLISDIDNDGQDD
ncbi:hypothetical protein C7H09_09735 [Marinobacter fuscus]|uniref:DUF5666 domain-containing protein n=1 Tax=Marinobacter fuscus TaxID=2109942 RepID=A0A2T1KAC7_9GAMM|nr:DUF5666 domain-containing protein [Marinobacter fuscus]PSF07074.1 hypothetical protein C7H09_09735 [Marinobacter fuscus]